LLEFRMAFERIARDVPAFACVEDVADGEDLAGFLSLFPGDFDLAGPDFGRDVYVAALQRGKHRQGFTDFYRCFAAIAMFDDKAFDAGQDEVGFPVQAAEAYRAVDFTGNCGGGGRCPE